MVRERVLLLVGHGTIAEPGDVPEFLTRVRRGRPPSAALVEEIGRRYAHIGHSPLLDVTREVASALEERLSLRTRVAMRFFHPFVEDVVRELADAGVSEICALPMAPYSVHVYVGAVSEALAGLAATRDRVPSLSHVAPYGSEPSLVAAHAAQIAPSLAARRPETTALVLTAHSLPTRVIAAGDSYQTEFEDSARRVAAALGWPARIAYQSQGADGGDWLGPRLGEVLSGVAREGKRTVVVAPVGFVADHVETLYDLDVEAAAEARALGLDFVRVPALNAAPAFVDALATVARRALG
jgi:ferrochelatase